MSPFWGDTMISCETITPVICDEDFLSIHPHTPFFLFCFFWSSLTMDQKPTKFSAKTFFCLVFTNRRVHHTYRVTPRTPAPVVTIVQHFSSNRKPTQGFSLRDFCFVMKITGYRNICPARGPRPPQLKFNDLFNQHFPWLIFF